MRITTMSNDITIKNDSKESKSSALNIPTMFSQSSRPFAGLALPNIASRVFNVPLAITSEKAEQILAFLTPRIEGKVPIEQALLELGDSEEYASSMHVPTFEEVAKANGVDVIPRVEGPPTPQAVQSARALDTSNQDLGFDIIPNSEGNIGVVPVNGTLVQRGAYLRESSGMTSYQGITTTINNALADERVASILMYVNSPGGEAYGLFDLANSLRALAQADPTVQSKPIFAFTDGVMASAAYAIGSSAARVYSEEIATVGSIGVIMVHREQSAKNAAEGIKVTYITSGTQKADGNPDEPLSPETQSRFQSKVNTIAQTFFNAVAASRQGADSKVSLSAQDIAALQAGTFLGGEANEKGLTDGVRTLRAVVDELSIEMRDRKKNKNRRYSTELTASPQSKTQLRFQVDVKPRVQAQAQIQAQAQVQVQPTGGHQTMTQAAAAPAPAAQLPSISLFDANGNPVPLEQLFTSIPQFAQMTQQLSDLQTKLADREEKLDRQTGRVETLLTSQEQKDMTLFVNTRLRGLPIQPAHMVSMLMRLKPLDAQLYGEMLTTFTVLARVFQKTSVITQQKGHAVAGDPYASVVHRGEGADTGGQHSVNARTHVEQFISQDGTVAFELTPQIKAFEAAVQKYMTEHQVTELTAIEIVTKERPDLIDAAKNSQGPAAGSLQPANGYVQNRPGADVYDPNTAPIDAADAEGILNLPEGITAAQILDPVSDKDLIGASAGPDVDQYLNDE